MLHLKTIIVLSSVVIPNKRRWKIKLDGTYVARGIVCVRLSSQTVLKSVVGRGVSTAELLK